MERDHPEVSIFNSTMSPDLDATETRHRAHAHLCTSNVCPPHLANLREACGNTKSVQDISVLFKEFNDAFQIVVKGTLNQYI